MIAAAKPDHNLTAELRNWLQVAHEFPQSYRRIRRRVSTALVQNAPALIFLATHEKTPAGQTALRMLSELIAENQDVDTLLTLRDLLPPHTSILANVGVMTTARILKLNRRSFTLEPLEAVTLWSELSEQCADADRFHEALKCAETAARLSLGLTRDQPLHLRVIARMLLRLTQRRFEHQDNRGALQACEQAWNIASTLLPLGMLEDRELAAKAAVVRANLLAERGRIAQAVAGIHAAAKIMRRLPKSEAARLDLAITQLTLAKQLTRLEQHAAAQPHAESAERFLRVLAAREPDQYLDLANAASVTYAQNLAHTGQAGRAYALLRTATTRLGEQAQRQPKRFGADFCASLIEWSHVAGKLGLFEEARRCGMEAVRQAQRTGRQLHRRDWYLEGKAHENLACTLYRLDELPRAEKAARAAVRAFGRLRGMLPEGRLLECRALRVWAEIQLAAGRGAKTRRALATVQRAWRGLSRSHPHFREVTLLEKAYCSSTLAICLESLGRLAEAVAQERQSLALRRKLFGKSRGLDREHLAYSLHALGRRLFKMGLLQEAKAAMDGSLKHYEAVVSLAPERITSILAEPWKTRAQIHLAQQRLPQGIQDLERAIQLLLPHHAQQPELWESVLIPLCALYANTCEIARLTCDKSLLVGDSQAAGSAMISPEWAGRHR